MNGKSVESIVPLIQAFNGFFFYFFASFNLLTSSDIFFLSTLSNNISNSPTFTSLVSIKPQIDFSIPKNPLIFSQTKGIIGSNKFKRLAIKKYLIESALYFSSLI